MTFSGPPPYVNKQCPRVQRRRAAKPSARFTPERRWHERSLIELALLSNRAPLTT